MFVAFAILFAKAMKYTHTMFKNQLRKPHDEHVLFVKSGKTSYWLTIWQNPRRVEFFVPSLQMYR